MVFPTYVQLYKNCSTLFCEDFIQPTLLDLLEQSSSMLSSSLSTLNQVNNNLLTSKIEKSSISAGKSLDFLIIIKWSSYYLINICRNRIYGVFIVKGSYKYQSRNLSNPVWSFCHHMQCFDRQLIKTLILTFILVTFNLYICE